MLYTGAKGTMTPNNRLQRTALPRRYPAITIQPCEQASLPRISAGEAR